jgi:anti-sigma factor RsiW
MNNELYRKLVDMYAGGELPEELEQELRGRALSDSGLAIEMQSLSDTVDALRAIPDPEFTEESYQRVLMRLYARGADIRPTGPTPTHLQYYLPIQG